MKTTKKVMTAFINEYKSGTPTREYHSPEVDVELRHYRMPIYYDMDGAPLERESTVAITINEQHFELSSGEVILAYQLQKFLEGCLNVLPLD